MPNNIVFTCNYTNHLELWFSNDYTIEEITKIVNNCIKEGNYNITDTQIPEYYKKMRLSKYPIKLWD